MIEFDTLAVDEMVIIRHHGGYAGFGGSGRGDGWLFYDTGRYLKLLRDICYAKGISANDRIVDSQ